MAVQVRRNRLRMAGLSIAIANRDGKWLVHLPGKLAGGPFELLSRWVHARHPNIMAGPQNAYHEIEDADLTDIRFLEVEHKKTLKPLHEFTLHSGKIGDGKTVMRFDVVAYYFFRRMNQDPKF